MYSDKIEAALQKWTKVELFSDDPADFPDNFQPSDELLEARFEAWKEHEEREMELEMRKMQRRRRGI
jgi:hypothetical protein